MTQGISITLLLLEVFYTYSRESDVKSPSELSDDSDQPAPSKAFSCFP